MISKSRLPIWNSCGKASGWIHCWRRFPISLMITTNWSNSFGAIWTGLAVFSAGRDNRFGFPHPEVAARLRCPSYTTGRDGAVTVTIAPDGSLSAASLDELDQGTRNTISPRSVSAR